jgi:hypothetical protein
LSDRKPLKLTSLMIIPEDVRNRPSVTLDDHGHTVIGQLNV